MQGMRGRGFRDAGQPRLPAARRALRCALLLWLAGLRAQRSPLALVA